MEPVAEDEMDPIDDEDADIIEWVRYKKLLVTSWLLHQLSAITKRTVKNRGLGGLVSAPDRGLGTNRILVGMAT